jgi:chromosome segregation ATPase
MNDQIFVNTYIKILNDTLTEAINKNLVMQAQLEIAKTSASKVVELENKIKEMTSVSSENSTLQTQINSLKTQLEQSNAQVTNKNSHVETFKRELVDARNIIKNLNNDHASKLESLKKEHELKVESLNAEIETLKRDIQGLKSKKRKKKEALNTLESFSLENSSSISVSDTF